jgi:hypothetical protein
MCHKFALRTAAVVGVIALAAGVSSLFADPAFAQGQDQGFCLADAAPLAGDVCAPVPMGEIPTPQ